MLVLGMQQRDSVIRLFLFFFQTRFRYNLLQVTVCSSLLYTLGPGYIYIYKYIFIYINILYIYNIYYIYTKYLYI